MYLESHDEAVADFLNHRPKVKYLIFGAVLGICWIKLGRNKCNQATAIRFHQFFI